MDNQIVLIVGIVVSLISIVTPIIKFNTTINKLNFAVSCLKKTMDETVEKLNNQEKTIILLENKLERSDKNGNNNN